MGRILEALKQAGPARPVTVAQPPPSRVLPPPDETLLSPNVPEEIPFIEVGGTGLIIDASPAVLNARTSARQTAARAKASRHAAPTMAESGLAAGTDVVSLTFRALAAPLPQERFARELVAFHDAAHPLAEQYRSLWAGLPAPAPRQGAAALLFLAVGSVTGKTTVVLNLAITCARAGKSVLVIEMSAGTRTVAGYLGLSDRPGLSDLATGPFAAEDIIQETGLANLCVITAGGRATSPLPAGALENVVSSLRSRFELIFLDGPSWSQDSDGHALNVPCDALYAVVRQTESQAPEVDGLLRRIASGRRLAGCILTNP